ncbi:VCP-like ATPase [uncultured archaeon]|nr:VCP-like ATPase [uncultured archaeon]
MATKEKIIKLKVVEAMQDDAYKGIARIDSEIMRELDIRRGDVIVIKGNRETVAIVDRAYPADVGEGIIRIDGILRKNSRTGIGDVVTIAKAEIKEAKKIVIAPAQKNIMVQGDPESLRRGLLGRAIMKGDIVVLGGVQRRKDLMSEDSGDMDDMLGNLGEILGGMGFGGMGLGNLGGGGISQIKFMVISTTPNHPTIITENTEVVLNSHAVELTDEKIPEITYEDLGGLNEEIKKIREMVELPLKHPEIFERLGIEPPKGVLLYGPPGTGKTLLAKAVAHESEANFISISGPEIFDKFYGESEKNIKRIFDDAEKNAPSIIFFDEIDSLAPSREDNLHSGEVERRVVSQLLTMMDGLKSRGRVIVIAATNRPDALDEALRRPGRFDREIEINIPNKDGRLQILKIHTRNMPLDKSVNLENLASITHGFVGADISALAKEAAMAVLRKAIPEINLKEEEKIPAELIEKLRISQKDFEEALKFIRPSALREVAVETPNVSWDDIGGIESVKMDLNEAVEWPLKFPESFIRLGIKPPKGILLYGPPGTGKTLLAKAVAKESEANFIQVDGPELQKEGIVGKETERLRKMFKRARQVAPCIIFFDEIDSFARRRGSAGGAFSDSHESLLNTLLTEMDGLEDLKNVVVIGATNRPDMLDSALLRPGRFDRLVLVPVPSVEGRLQILKIHTKKMPLGDGKKLLSEKEREELLKYLAKETDGYTGADLESFCREAAMLTLRKDKNAKMIGKENFEDAMKKVPPSVSKQQAELYKKMESEYLKSAKAALPVDNSYLG